VAKMCGSLGTERCELEELENEHAETI